MDLLIIDKAGTRLFAHFILVSRCIEIIFYSYGGELGRVQRKKNVLEIKRLVLIRTLEMRRFNVDA